MIEERRSSREDRIDRLYASHWDSLLWNPTRTATRLARGRLERSATRVGRGRWQTKTGRQRRATRRVRWWREEPHFLQADLWPICCGWLNFRVVRHPSTTW